MLVHYFTAGSHAVERPGIVADTGVQLVGTDIHKGTFLKFSFAKPVIQAFSKSAFSGIPSVMFISILFGANNYY